MARRQEMSGKDQDGWITVGAVAGAHGVRGDLKVKSFTGEEAALFAFADLRMGRAKAPVTLRKKKRLKDGFVCEAQGVRGRDAAEALRGTTLYVAREALDAVEEDEFYLVDLIGLEARGLDGKPIGSVRALENFGAEDLVELLLKEPIKGLGRYVFVPFRRTFVPTVDTAGGFIVVDMAAWAADQAGGEAVEKGEAAGTVEEGERGD